MYLTEYQKEIIKHLEDNPGVILISSQIRKKGGYFGHLYYLHKQLMKDGECHIFSKDEPKRLTMDLEIMVGMKLELTIVQKQELSSRGHMKARHMDDDYYVLFADKKDEDMYKNSNLYILKIKP